MDIREIKALALQVRTTLENLLRVRVLRRDLTWPHVAVYHANYRCNAACSFCSRELDILNEKRIAKRPGELGLEKIAVIFGALRQLVGALYIAGGEPLLQRNIEEMLALARAIGFYPVAVNTNATLLDQRPEVPRYADITVVSIHAVDVDKTAKIFQVSRRLAEKSFKNIVEAVHVARRHGNRVVANCVLTEDNLGDAHDVLDFCLNHGITFGVVPAIEGYLPSIAAASAAQVAQYRAFLARVIEQKYYHPRSVQASNAFLHRMYELGRFDCRPTGILTVSPDGHVVNPCDYKYKMAQHIGLIDGTRLVRDVLTEAMDYQRGFAPCDRNCLKACYAEPALALEVPLQAMADHMARALVDVFRGYK